MSVNEYGLTDHKNIYQYSIPESSSPFKIYDRNFPTNPLTGIRFHVVDNNCDLYGIAPLLIKETTNTSDNIFVIDLNEQIIGDYYFIGLISDNVEKPREFFSDLKNGKINIGIINVEETLCDNTVGYLVQQLTTLCGNNPNPTIHIFLKESSSKEFVAAMNEVMKVFFIRTMNNKEEDRREY